MMIMQDKPSGQDSPNQTDQALGRWRQEIDALDDQLLEILSRRALVVLEIGKFKKANNLAPLDPVRWEQMLEKNVVHGQSLALSRAFVEGLYHLIHEYSLELEHQSE